VDDDKVAWAKATLERHIVFDDVRLHRPAAAVVTLQGVQSAAVLAAAGLPVPAAGAHVLVSSDLGQAEGDATGPGGRAEAPQGVSFYPCPGRRSAAGGFDLCPVAWPEAVALAAGAEPTAAAGDTRGDAVGDAVSALLAELVGAGAVAAGRRGLAAARVAGVV